MNRIDRLMGIITLLQGHTQVSSEAIARHFGISERTVYRDLKAIGEIGVPVYFDPEKGYRVAPGFFLPPVSLTEEEANALAMAEPLLIRFADVSILQHYQAAMLKIKMVLNKKQREQLERNQGTMAHFIPDNYVHLLPHTDYLSTIQQAINEKRILEVAYLNQKEERSKRKVEPIGLLFYSLNWHMIGWCHLKQEYRDFRTSRIQQLKMTLQEFTKTDHPALDAYLQSLQKHVRENPQGPLAVRPLSPEKKKG